MDSEREDRCETCRFWGSDGRMAITDIWCGYCQRFPPVPIYIQEDDCIDSRGEGCDAYFPITYHENWCGEWQAKSKLPTAAEVLEKMKIKEAAAGLGRIMDGPPPSA